MRSLIAVLLVFLAGQAWGKDLELEEITPQVRDAYLARAQVWHPTNIPRMNVVAGPRSSIAVPPNQLVACRYLEWEKPATGASPKFRCELKSGEEVRIKYGLQTKEVFAEVAATRLFWALGFYTDAVYPVRIRCIGCPESNPFQPEPNERRITRTIDYALMELWFPGAILEAKDDQGWAWDELDKVDMQQGGATRAQLDALRLLAVFVQHGDNKPEQQRIGCYRPFLEDPDGDGKASCKQPVLMVQDLGASFGRADFSSSEQAKMNIELWADKPIWNKLKEAEHYERTGERACFGNLTRSVVADGGLEDPRISEAGRKFLAGLLVQLTDSQIRELFRIARVDRMNEMIEQNGAKRPVTVDDWVRVFKTKRDEIVNRTCPE